MIRTYGEWKKRHPIPADILLLSVPCPLFAQVVWLNHSSAIPRGPPHPLAGGVEET